MPATVNSTVRTSPAFPDGWSAGAQFTAVTSLPGKVARDPRERVGVRQARLATSTGITREVFSWYSA